MYGPLNLRILIYYSDIDILCVEWAQLYFYEKENNIFIFRKGVGSFFMGRKSRIINVGGKNHYREKKFISLSCLWPQTSSSIITGPSKFMNSFWWKKLLIESSFAKAFFPFLSCDSIVLWLLLPSFSSFNYSTISSCRFRAYLINARLSAGLAEASKSMFSNSKYTIRSTLSNFRDRLGGRKLKHSWKGFFIVFDKDFFVLLEGCNLTLDIYIILDITYFYCILLIFIQPECI